MAYLSIESMRRAGIGWNIFNYEVSRRNMKSANKMFPVKRALLMALLVLVLAASRVRAADKLRVGNCNIGGGILPLWMAKDAGLYAREGLDVERIWLQVNPAVASLVAGEIDLLYCIPHNVIGAIAGGADLRFIASNYYRMQYRIVAAPGIEKVEQLIELSSLAITAYSID